MYNGRDGVVTDANGLLYMRARYYSPDLMRFVNADIVAGDISNAITLNRYAYANGNPVSNVDPFGLSPDWENIIKVGVGVAVIAGLAVATAVTGGAAAVIAGTALAGAVVGGTVGAASGYKKEGIDGAIDGFMTGTVVGAGTGTLVSSVALSLPVVASATGPSTVMASSIAKSSFAGAIVNTITTGVGNLITGQGFSAEDVIVSASSGALNSIPGVGLALNAVIVGGTTTVSAHEDGANWGAAIASGAFSSFVSTATIGNLAELQNINLSTATNVMSDLTFGAGFSFLSSAVSKSAVEMGDKERAK